MNKSRIFVCLAVMGLILTGTAIAQQFPLRSNWGRFLASVTASNPIIETGGVDANVGLDVNLKGTGVFRLDNGTDPVDFRLRGAAGGFNSLFSDVNGNELFRLQGVASAVNQLDLRNAATGANPRLDTSGDDTNIGLDLVLKGTGAFRLDNGTDPVDFRVMGAVAGFNSFITDLNGNELLRLQGVASAVNQIDLRNAATGVNPRFDASGETNVSIDLRGAGTGGITINGTAVISEVRTATATLDFASAAATVCSADLTVTVTGAAANDVVSLGIPNASVNAGSVFWGWVSAADTVTVRHCNVSAGANDPASGTYRVTTMAH